MCGSGSAFAAGAALGRGAERRAVLLVVHLLSGVAGPVLPRGGDRGHAGA